jgi:hypothetical protein
MIGNTNGALAALGAQIQGKPTDAQMARWVRCANGRCLSPLQIRSSSLFQLH